MLPCFLANNFDPPISNDWLYPEVGYIDCANNNSVSIRKIDLLHMYSGFLYRKVLHFNIGHAATAYIMFTHARPFSL